MSFTHLYVCIYKDFYISLKNALYHFVVVMKSLSFCFWGTFLKDSFARYSILG